MLASILASGLAAGAIYALVGVTYNTMFSTSRVMSFTAGQLAMLGGVFGSMFTLKMGMPILVGFLLTLLGCAIIGIITEFVAVRPVLKSLDQHLYVLSTLALALMIQQVAAIKWGTEPQPFPRLVGWGSGVFDEKFWLPVVACAITIIGLEYLYRRTLVGRAFMAIAEDNFAARALGLSNVRIMFKHLLPNAMVATLTFMPFILNGSITTLTSLDFLGLGMPPGSPSLGEMLAQGKANIQAPWLGITGFLVIGLMLSLLIFIGEGVRDCFDPRKTRW